MENASARATAGGRPPAGAWVERYLALLGQEREMPGLEALEHLTRAHLLRVPFESVTSILRRRAHPDGAVPPLDPEALLTAWEERRAGALCFDAAEMVSRLLAGLGYRAHPVRGTIGAGWTGGHQGVMVELDDRQFIVDVGNGAPFFEPIRLEDEVVVRGAGLAYRFHPGETADEWIQDRLIEGEWKPFCRYDLRPATPEEREAAYQRHHVPTESWVASVLTLVRCEEGRVTLLRGAELTRFTDAGKHVEYISDAREYRRLATKAFGLPNLPIDEAIRALEKSRAS